MEKHPYKTITGFGIQLNMSEEEISTKGFKNGGIWFHNTKSIVCGTFPPKKEYLNRKGYIHYSSPKNKFWSHIDAIYDTSLYINKVQAAIAETRIDNALKKISFLTKMNVGFVDVFSAISRKDSDSSKDDDIIEPFETIFDIGVFQDILNSDIKNIIFVYSRSYDEFINGIHQHYPGNGITQVREYGKNQITLQVENITIDGKQLNLSYSPIHGRIKDVFRRPALKKALEMDFT